MKAVGGLEYWHSYSHRISTKLGRSGLDSYEVQRVISLALGEDLRYGPDVTTEATIPVGTIVEAHLIPRTPGVLSGVLVALAVFDTVLGAHNYEAGTIAQDGDPLIPGQPVLTLRGPARGILTAERAALNLVCHLSGIATITAAWVAAVQGTGCIIRDSRKTLPGLRLLQKYAVRCGGGINHRLGLGDAVLIKDNHVAACGGVATALKAARAHAPHLPCEVEVSSLAELDEILVENPELVLLDNFSPQDCAEAVRRTRAANLATKLEASGGLTLPLARTYAETGVDYLAIGALTHSAPSVDLGLDLR